MDVRFELEEGSDGTVTIYQVMELSSGSTRRMKCQKANNMEEAHSVIHYETLKASAIK